MVYSWFSTESLFFFYMYDVCLCRRCFQETMSPEQMSEDHSWMVSLLDFYQSNRFMSSGYFSVSIFPNKHLWIVKLWRKKDITLLEAWNLVPDYTVSYILFWFYSYIIWCVHKWHYCMRCINSEYASLGQCCSSDNICVTMSWGSNISSQQLDEYYFLLLWFLSTYHP